MILPLNRRRIEANLEHVHQVLRTNKLPFTSCRNSLINNRPKCRLLMDCFGFWLSETRSPAFSWLNMWLYQHQHDSTGHIIICPLWTTDMHSTRWGYQPVPVCSHRTRWPFGLIVSVLTLSHTHTHDYVSCEEEQYRCQCRWLVSDERNGFVGISWCQAD